MSSTFERLQAVLKKENGIEPERVTQDATLESLGLDSLDLIELLFEVEDEFNIRIPQDGGSGLRMAKVQDIVDSIDAILAGGGEPSASPSS